MALRWVRTIDEAPHMFASRDEEDLDWLLYCGGWQVGRVHRPGGARQDLISWSLTGPHAPLVIMRGNTAAIDEAKDRLIDALRTWAAWAGVKRDGTETPRWVRSSEHQPRHFGPAYEDETDWLLLSGAFVVGRVHRPLGGPRHDPHWALTGAHTSQAPLDKQGWADSVEDGKAKLFGAWCEWLQWAELPVPDAFAS